MDNSDRLKCGLAPISYNVRECRHHFYDPFTYPLPKTPIIEFGAKPRFENMPFEGKRRSLSTNEEVQASIIPTATYKMPPNWKQHHQKVLREHLSYRTFRVRSNTQEFDTIEALLDPASIQSVEQIVNPTLFNQFNMKRKEMLKSKSVDVDLLFNIGFSKKEIKGVLQYSKDFSLYPKVADVPYNDNMALLFHCTRNAGNIESILTTGLDERIGTGGLLGRGIYFSDSHKKSMMYDNCGVIFICAVLLGDCLSMNKKQGMDFVREPSKTDAQKRNHNDLFFDSIVGKPGSGDNEYVIYNRHQCLPLYMVKYEKETRLTIHGRFGFGGSDFMNARKDFPPFCWMSNGSEDPMPSLRRMVSNNWSLYTNNIFEKMGVVE